MKGKPAMARVANIQVAKVTGSFFRRPPIWPTSWVWTAWMTEPDPRKRQALKKAWVTRWNMPAW